LASRLLSRYHLLTLRQLSTKEIDMKFVKTLLAIAALGSAVAAHAESNIASGTAANLTASARLNFNVVIPRVLYLRVGTGTDFTPNPTIDTVTFSPAAGNVGTGTAVAGTPATVAVRVLSTGGSITLGATGSGLGLTAAGLPVIPWTQITGGSDNPTFPLPTIGGAASSIAAIGGVVSQTANWNFNYGNTATLPGGTYAGVVTYTATLP
jgi:hypothetical protein